MTSTRRVLLLWSFLLMSGACLLAHGQMFTNPARVAVPTDPDTVLAGDLNGDGRVDLIWFHVTATNSVGHVELAQTNGGYRAGATVTIPGAPTGVPTCAAADVTRDGRLDLICATLYYQTQSVTISVFPGNGDGTFGSPILTQQSNHLGQGIILTLVGDLNGDGLPDFILADDYYTPALVLLSDGAGGFLPPKTVQNSYNYSSAISVDINGDGIPDILWPNGAGVTLGEGDGSFADLVSPYPLSNDPVTCAFGDLDGDGKLDALCGYLTNGSGAGTAFDILHGNGDGTFNPTPISHHSFGDPSVNGSGSGDFLFPALIRDLNGDGIPDLLASSGDGLAVLLGGPGLTFGAPAHYASAFSGYAFPTREAAQTVYTDLNGDGLVDVLAAGPNGIYLTFGHADGTFGSAVATKVSEVEGHFAIADLNGDGKPDLVSTGAPATSLSIGNGDGTFAAPTPIQGAPFAAGSPLFLTDFSGDGKPDLLATDASLNYYLMFGKGDGTFASPIATTGLAPAPSTTSIADNRTVPHGLTADLNADGKADLFNITGDAVSPTYGLVSALSNGDGTFHSVTTTYAAPPYLAPTYYQTPVAPVLADFAHRGKLDAAYFLNESVYVVRGNGDGSFDATPTILSIPEVAGVKAIDFQALQVADLDGDGNLDIAFLSSFQATFFYQGGPSCVFVYFGKGDGTFALPAQAGCFTHAYTDLRIADFDGDGRPDIVLQTASTLNNYAVAIIDNLGNRTFGPEINYTAGSLSGDIAVADLNLDGRPDLIFGNQRYETGYSANSVTVLLNQSSPVAKGQLSSSPNPSYVGQPFTLTATLTPPSAGITYTGEITFYVDGNAIGSVVLSGNAATVTGPTNLASGVHQISAIWPGDATDPSLTFTAAHTVLLYPLDIKLACTPNPSSLGQAVLLATTFTPTTTAGVPAPVAQYPGTLGFYDGETLLGQQQVSTAGFSYTTSALSGGPHTLSASYSGDSVFASATGSCSEVVNKLPTRSDLSLTPVPYAGQTFPLVAKVAPLSVTGLSPSGLVTFTVDGAAAGMAALDPTTGIVTYTDTGLSGGDHVLGCSYDGDANFTGSTCPAGALTVAPAPAALTLSSPANPAAAGAPILFTASLSSKGKPASSDLVVFTINSNGTTRAQGSAVTNANGNAVYRSPGLAPGTYTVTAVFAGNANLQSAQSPLLTQVVVVNSTATRLTASPNPGYVGSNIQFVAAVVSAGMPNLALPVASGTVTFYDDSVALGTQAVTASGTSTFTTSKLTVGTHPITAIYSPDTTNFAGSTSPSVNEVILAAGFSITLTPATLTLGPGEAGATEIQVASIGDFSGSLDLTYGTLPVHATASIDPSTVTLNAGTTASTRLTLNTLIKTPNARITYPGIRTIPVYFATLIVLLVPFGLRRRRAFEKLIGLAFLTLALHIVTGCTNAYYTATFVAPGTYLIPITATDTNHNSQKATLTLIVTP